MNEYSYVVYETAHGTWMVELTRGSYLIEFYEFGTRGAADRFGLRWLTDVIKFPYPSNL
ncbi:MAG: hypothetical protein ACHQU0_03770 [Candidatus Paceibacteria bacterium]